MRERVWFGEDRERMCIGRKRSGRKEKEAGWGSGKREEMEEGGRMDERKGEKFKGKAVSDWRREGKEKIKRKKKERGIKEGDIVRVGVRREYERERGREHEREVKRELMKIVSEKVKYFPAVLM